MLLEVHQPIRHLQIDDVEDRAVALERGRIFAVRIDHHDMALRRELADAVEDQRGAGRLAGAGRAEQREMLAEHRIDVERGADVRGRIDGADLDMRRGRRRRRSACRSAVVTGIDLRAGDRIAGDAAAEVVELAGQPLLVALAEEVDLAAMQSPAASASLQRADVGDQPRRADAHLDLAADLARRCAIDGIGVAGAARRARRGRAATWLPEPAISSTTPIG